MLTALKKAVVITRELKASKLVSLLKMRVILHSAFLIRSNYQRQLWND